MAKVLVEVLLVGAALIAVDALVVEVGGLVVVVHSQVEGPKESGG